LATDYKAPYPTAAAYLAAGAPLPTAADGAFTKPPYPIKGTTADGIPIMYTAADAAYGKPPYPAAAAPYGTSPSTYGGPGSPGPAAYGAYPPYKYDPTLDEQVRKLINQEVDNRLWKLQNTVD